MSNQYKRFFKLLEQWPVDSTKKGRDLGEYLRTRAKKEFSVGEINLDNTRCDRQYLALKTLVQSVNAAKYTRKYKSSSTGLSAEHCKIALSDAFLKEVNENDKSFLRRAYENYFGRKNTTEKK